MDKLLFKFDSATDLDQNGSRFNSLYKNNDQLNKKQHQRRNEILSNRSSKKDQLIASIRGLVSEVAGDDDSDETNIDDTSQDCANPVVSIIVDNEKRSTTNIENSDHNTTNNTGMGYHDSNNFNDSNTGDQNANVKSAKGSQDRKFRNKAMLSEWLLDRPVNFETEWIMKPTPVGKRCLVFARKGETVAYSRTGQFIKAFQSTLPGGNRYATSQCRRQFAIVDCIYIHHKNAFYLMDALAWNEHKLYESEASFRFFWLQSRYNENKDKLLAVNTRNEARFYCLKTYSVNNQDILTALNNDALLKDHNLYLDGLLFFHARGPYVPGANPLVLWIKPDMVNRVLSVPSN